MEMDFTDGLMEGDVIDVEYDEVELLATPGEGNGYEKTGKTSHVRGEVTLVDPRHRGPEAAHLDVRGDTYILTADGKLRKEVANAVNKPVLEGVNATHEFA